VLDNCALERPFDARSERRHDREIPEAIEELIDDP
jgi:hypothetical protein